jgi:fibro-slime domain-containing protein/RHS repeat-associated protein
MARRTSAANRRPYVLSRRHRTSRHFVPTIQALESRQLLVAGAFLQGTAYVDLNANAKLDQTEPYEVGATVKLYSSDGSTLLGTTVTDANGYYRFDDSDVAGGNLQAGTYRIVETPPLGSVNTGAQVVTPMGASSVLGPNTIQATVISPSNLTLTFNNTILGKGVTIVGNGTSEGTFAGQLGLTLSQSGTTITPIVAECLDLFHQVAGGNTFAVLPRSLQDAFPVHGGQIAYLFNHYGQLSTLTSSQAAGLQIALWELEIDTLTNLNAGNFIANSSGVDATTLAAANSYLTESIGRNETALFFDATLGGQSVPTSGRQGMLGSSSYNFSNIALASLSGYTYDDANNDGRKQTGDPGVAGATVTLAGTDLWGRTVRQTVPTASDGSYVFAHLYPGTYSVLETPPTGTIDGKVTPGPQGGTAGFRSITTVVLNSGIDGTNYNFGYDRPPVFVSTAPDQIAVNQLYTYTAQATDPDADPLSYSLLAGPSGLTVSSAGLVTWTPSSTITPSDVGTHPIRLQVSDGRGGIAEQDYTLNVLPAGINRPPHYTTTPVVDAYVTTPYVYQSAAVDPDNDALHFTLTSGPAGLAYDSSGKVTWTPTVQQLGLNPVSLKVDDGHGGFDVQNYNIMVHPAATAPYIHIISTPPTTYQFPVWAVGTSIVNDVTIRDVPMTFADVQQGVSTGIVTGLVNPLLGLMQIAAGTAGTSAAVIIDSGSSGGGGGKPIQPGGGGGSSGTFTQTGSGWTTDASGGHNASQLITSAAGTGANTATWQMTGLTTGDYAVQATWFAKATLATNATYKITDGSNTLATVTVNQTVTPSGTTYDSVPFQSLANVHITTGTLDVILTDAANAGVAADAVRIAPAEDLAWSALTAPATGTAGATFTVPRTYTISGNTAPNFTIAYFASPNTALGQGGDLLLGTETVSGSANLSVGSHAGNSPNLIWPGSGGSYHLFAKIDAAGAITEGDETNNVIAATQIVTVSGPLIFPPTFDDDSSSGFSTTGSGWTVNSTSGYNGSYHKTSAAGTGANTATWQLTGLAAGNYQVQVTWANATGQATNAAYTLSDGATPRQTITVDQTQKPLGPGYSASPFQSAVPFQTLATIQVSSGTLKVVLTDNANGPVLADAIRVTAVLPVDLNWVGGGVAGPTVLSPGSPFTIERAYTVTGQAPTMPFTIAYYASNNPTPGGGADYLLATETISGTANLAVGTHDGNSPTLTLPVAGGTYYIYATIDAGGTVPENDTTNDVGMVRGRTPTYSGLTSAGTIIHSDQTFYDWYHDVPGVNQTELFPLVMTQDPNISTQYDFSSSAFFPIDGQLYGNDNKSYPDHNYNFMVEFHGSFTYRGGEQFSISSDDDSWVFVNNQLVLDNGGLHGQAGGTVNIDQLNQPSYQGKPGMGLAIGQTYPIDIFYAERQTNAAALQTQTNLQFTPEAPYTYQVQAVDSDGGAISYALLKGPLGMSINPQDGLVYWQPSRDQVGTYTVTVEALDANGATDTQTYTLTVSIASGGNPPRFTSHAPTVVNPGDTYSYQPIVSSSAGDPLVFTLVSGPNISPTDKMLVNGQTGALSWTPQPGDFGQAFLVTLKVADNQGGSDIQQFNLQVNDTADTPPSFTSNPLKTASVGQLYAYLATATDVDNDPLTYDLPVHPTGMVINPYNGQIDWVPTSDLAGSQSVVVRVQDGRGGVDLQTFQIAVAALDTAPFITSIPTGTPQVGLPFEYAVLAQDAEKDPLTYSFSPAVTGMKFDTSRHNVLTWTPAAAGAPNVTITVSDGRGGTATQLFNLSAVAPQTNRAPTITSTPRNSIALGLTYYYQVVATDLDGDHLTYVLDTPLTGVTLDVATGLMSWTPTSSQLGAHPLQIHVSDGRGGSAPQSVPITVTTAGSNGAPTITSSPRLTGVVGLTYSYNAVATDPDYDLLVWSLAQAPAGLSINPLTGTLRWLPNQVGTFPVQVKVSDPYGGTSIQPFTITIRGTDSPPLITSTPPTTGGTTSAYSYSVQATDPDGDPLTYAITSSFPAGLAFSTTTPNLLQWSTPIAGTYPLEITVSDGLGGADIQDWTLTVAAGPADRPPNITSTPGTHAVVGKAYSYTLTSTDPDNDTVTYSMAAGAPSWLTFTSSNVISGTPTTANSYPLTVIANDGKGGEALQSYTIVVTTNHSPTITSNFISSVVAGGSYEYAVVASDQDNDPITYSLSYTLPGGVAAGTPGPAIDQQGHVTWNPGVALKNTVWPVTITVTDPYLATGTQPFNLTVNADTTPPSVVVEASADQVNKGKSVIFTVVAADNAAVSSLGLTVAGQAVTLDGRGVATVTMNTAGSFAVIGTATDPSGNTGTSPTEYVTVIDPSVTDVPTVSIASLSSTLTAYNGINPTTQTATFNPVTITHGTSVTSTITINDPAKLLSLTATLNIAETNLAGLSATLTSPSGTTITLFSGLTGANLTNTVFDDTATTAIASGTAPYTGRFKPTQALSGLAGNAAAGTYTLKITNASATVNATLNGWSMSYLKAPTAIVSAPVDIIGTATDAQGFSSYTLKVALEGTSSWTTIGSGTTAVNGGVLGHLDPTILANGTYTVELTAFNTGGRSSTIDQAIDVEGNLKLGDFRQTFTDLTVNVSGIPIVVSRTYDSLDAGATGDFGYGWHLDVGDAKLKVNLAGNVGNGWGDYPPFEDNTRVYITLPGGTPQAYTFMPYEQSLDSLGLLNFWHPLFIPDANDTMSLSVLDEELSKDPNTGEYYSITDGGLDSYNPADPNYGGYFTLTGYDGTAYQIDAGTGKLQSISDLNGNTDTFTDSGVTNQYGIGITYVRDARDRITTVIDPQNNQIVYGYDAYGDLVTVTDQMNNVTTFSYNTASVLGQPGARPHYLQQINDPLNRPTTKAVYGPDGRLQYILDVNGAQIQLTFDPSQHVEAITDKLGHPTIFLSDDLGNVVQATQFLDANTQVTSKWAYDANNHLVSSTDPMGDQMGFTYDARGNPLSVTAPHATTDDPADFTTYYSYGQYGDITSVTDPSGASDNYAYDSVGNLLLQRDDLNNVVYSASYVSGGLLGSQTTGGVTSTYQYGATGQMTQSSDPDSGTITDNVNSSGWLLSTTNNGTTTVNGFDKSGRQTSLDDGQGDSMTYGYGYQDQWTTLNSPSIGQITRTLDTNGQVTEIDAPGGQKTLYQYDANGRLLKETDANGNVTQATYDALGRQTTSTNVTTGQSTATSYDLAGRITSQTSNGVTTTYTYYADSRTKTVTIGGQIWSYAYTPTMTIVTDPLGKVTKTKAGVGGAPDSEYLPNGAKLTQTTLSTTDEYGNALLGSANDAEGLSRKYSYNAGGAITSATDLAGNAYTLNYTSTGMQMTDPTGQTLSFAYDSQQRLQSITYMDGGNETLTYTGNATQPTTVKLPSNATVTYGYNAQGSVTSRSTSTGENATFGYNTQGALATATDATGSTVYTYDAFGMVATITYPTGASVAYHRDSHGRVDTITSKASATATAYVTRYQYDATYGRLTQVTDPLNGVTTLGYDLDARMTTITYPDGVTTTYTYDDNSQIASVVSKRNSDGTVLESSTYVRGLDGEPTKVTREDGTYVVYGYDTALRLTSETYFSAAGVSQGAITYAYDTAGNRSTMTNSTGTFNYSYLSGDRLSSVSGGGMRGMGGFQSYGYDANGDVSTISRYSQNLTLGYDTSGHVVSVQGLATGTEQYTYNGLGQRVAATDSSGKRNYLVAPSFGGLDSPYMVTDGSNNLVDDYVYVGDTPFMRIGADGKPIYYLTDGMGSVIGMADSTAASVARYTYDAFGNILTATGTLAAAPTGAGGDFRFHGGWLDTVTGFYDMRARTYDSLTGRFLSRDPAQPDPQRPEEQNPYIYALDNPSLYTDPTGQFEVIEVNISISMNDALSAIQTAAIQSAKEKAIAFLQEQLIGATWNLLKALVPELQLIDGALALGNLTKKQAGKDRQAALTSAFAGAIGLPSWLWLEVSLWPNGDAINNGINITITPKLSPTTVLDAVKGAAIVKGSSRPDFILGENAPTSEMGNATSWTVGDVKSSVVGLLTSYLFGYKNNPLPLRQFTAIANYSLRFCPAPIGLFICVKAGAPKTKLDSLGAMFAVKCVRYRFAPIIITILGGTGVSQDPIL